MIEKGLYVVRNFRDPYVIGTAMLKESAVAYWSALNLHGLTEQIPNIVYLQSIHSKRDKEVFGVRYKFVKVKPKKICGITTQQSRGALIAAALTLGRAWLQAGARSRRRSLHWGCMRTGGASLGRLRARWSDRIHGERHGGLSRRGYGFAAVGGVPAGRI